MFANRMETVLYIIIGVLCTILLLNLFYMLRSVLKYRVNCWFCNGNFWVKFVYRNCWTCPSCEQYNGFTKDGDYNKPIITAKEQVVSPPKVFHTIPPKNGLCKMCNINQQLKVAQLANFVPMNEKRYDDEIDNFRTQLEKAYKLCNPCKKVVQLKLHKEKETLLGSKVLENRSPEKKNTERGTQNTKLKRVINNTSMFIAVLLLILTTVECFRHIRRNKMLFHILTNIKDIAKALFERMFAIVKMKIEMTLPKLDFYINYTYDMLHMLALPRKLYLNTQSMEHLNDLSQKTLGGFVCLIQILGHLWKINQMKYAILIDLLWSLFVAMTIAHKGLDHTPAKISLLKFASVLALILIYKCMKQRLVKRNIKLFNTSNEKNASNNYTLNSMIADEDATVETDDDVSLSKFGLHNFTDSSNDTTSPQNNSLINGRSFTPRVNDSIWSKPKLNSTFCVNSAMAKSPCSVSETVSVKPSFVKYQNLAKDDSDSELDESISALCISGPKKSKQNKDSVFSLRKFTATPSFVVPTALNRARPLISPSKLGHGTSWVAGGYWGSDGERQIFDLAGSRSSSQSSGFESQTSSLTQRNIFSQPPSREESVCGESDRAGNNMFERFQSNCSIKSYPNTARPQGFRHASSPVFPQMQHNSHVHIPRPRLAPHNAIGHSVFHTPHSHSLFKAPNTNGIIKLPQVNSFASR